MATSVGDRIAHYEILEEIGKGGMGVVYRARDRRLEREVAIKSLPEELSRDPQRVERLQREAKLLAAVNHSHIGAIYGLERRDGEHFLILELVEGETLGERLRRGPLPVPTALEAARQIAEALEAAHERGIIHRDLKPDNVKLTPAGEVKVLDFGLAKDAAPLPAGDRTVTAGPTRSGVVLGTPGYMSPEQARGEAVDRKSDVWAFGCVLYQLLTGEAPFGGDTATDRLTAILHHEPDLAALPPATPPNVRYLLRRCLEKEPRQRLHDIADARLLIEDAGEEPQGTAATTGPGWRSAAVAAGLAFLLGGLAVQVLRRDAAPPPAEPIRRLQLQLGADERLPPALLPFALSPDGRRLAYVAIRGDERTLRLRELAKSGVRELPGTENASNPFFAPDGRWVGFFVGDLLKKVPVDGGPPVAIARLPSGQQGEPASGTWGPDDTIVFSTYYSEGLYRVPASGGGSPEALTELLTGENSHLFPQFLSGGDGVVFSVRAGEGVADASWIERVRLATGERRRLLDRGRQALPLASGHLLYADGGTIFAVPLDQRAGTLAEATPAVVLEGVSFGSGDARLSVSQDGVAAYDANPMIGTLPGRFVWVDRQGAREPIEAPHKAYTLVSLAPDGRRLAATVRTPTFRGGVALELWLLDLVRGDAQRFTSGGDNHYSIWTPDAERVLFTSDRDDHANLYWQPAVPGAAAERLLDSPLHQDPGSFSPDGRWIAYAQADPESRWDLWLADLDADRAARPFLVTPYDEIQPMFSPDGRFIAYASNESGRWESYVRPFAGDGQWKVSVDGGWEVLWSPRGDELFYRAGDAIMAVPVSLDGGFSAGRPHKLFSGRFRDKDGFGRSNWDITADGERFLMIELDEHPPATHLEIISGWFGELEELVPTGRGS